MVSRSTPSTYAQPTIADFARLLLEPDGCRRYRRDGSNLVDGPPMSLEEALSTSERPFFGIPRPDWAVVDIDGADMGVRLNVEAIAHWLGDLPCIVTASGGGADRWHVWVHVPTTAVRDRLAECLDPLRDENVTLRFGAGGAMRPPLGLHRSGASRSEIVNMSAEEALELVESLATRPGACQDPGGQWSRSNALSRARRAALDRLPTRTQEILTGLGDHHLSRKPDGSVDRSARSISVANSCARAGFTPDEFVDLRLDLFPDEKALEQSSPSGWLYAQYDRASTDVGTDVQAQLAARRMAASAAKDRSGRHLKPNVLRTFETLLGAASKLGMFTEISMSCRQLSELTGFEPKTVRNHLVKLKETGMVSVAQLGAGLQATIYDLPLPDGGSTSTPHVQVPGGVDYVGSVLTPPGSTSRIPTLSDPLWGAGLPAGMRQTLLAFEHDSVRSRKGAYRHLRAVLGDQAPCVGTVKNHVRRGLDLGILIEDSDGLRLAPEFDWDGLSHELGVEQRLHDLRDRHAEDRRRRASAWADRLWIESGLTGRCPFEGVGPDRWVDADGVTYTASEVATRIHLAAEAAADGPHDVPVPSTTRETSGEPSTPSDLDHLMEAS